MDGGRRRACVQVPYIRLELRRQFSGIGSPLYHMSLGDLAGAWQCMLLQVLVLASFFCFESVILTVLFICISLRTRMNSDNEPFQIQQRHLLLPCLCSFTCENASCFPIAREHLGKSSGCFLQAARLCLGSVIEVLLVLLPNLGVALWH